MKIKVAPYAENMCEAGLSCLLTMVQGNVLALTISHWLIASQTGLVAGAIVGTTVIAANLRRPWVVSLTLGAVTMAVDAVVHPATFGVASLREAAVTGVGAFVLSLIVNATLQHWRSALRRASRLASLCLSLIAGNGVQAEPIAGLPVEGVIHASASVRGVEIFYREAGPKDAPGVLLLHGFPSSSFMFRHLLPALGDRWRVVAPDYPGFGGSDFPSAETFDYTFANLAAVVGEFTDSIGLDTYAIYVQDYGAPIGLRLALERPERVRALIVQNGNAYAEGMSAAWDPLKAYWGEPTPENRERLRGWLTAEGVREQYAAGVPDALVERLSPDTWTLDWLRLGRPGNIDMQLDLFGDYASNVALYPQLQALLRTHQWPTLVAWGRFDPFFTVDGARAYARDLPHAEIHLLDAGHFALETHWPEIAVLMREFLGRTDAAAASTSASAAVPNAF